MNGELDVVPYALEIAADKLESESIRMFKIATAGRISSAKVSSIKQAACLLRKAEVIRIHRAFLNPKGITYV